MYNIAIIKQGTGRYLFSVPENVTLREGDRVKCDTRRGITDGIAFADSAWVDENVSQLLGKLMGAKFPLKPVVGKMEYLPFGKPEDKPAEDKPIKLYCVKDYTPFYGVELIKGTVCTFIPTVGALELPGGRRVGSAGCPRSYDEWKADNPFRAACLVPLVKRPAKVGEWVYDGDHGFVGIVAGNDLDANVWAKNKSGKQCIIMCEKYEVLDGLEELMA